MAKAESGSFRITLHSILYYLASLLMPGIFLFNLYERNRVENHLGFFHVIILAFALAVIGVMLFVALSYFTKSKEGALLISLLFWLFFWFFRILFGFVTRFFPILSPAGLMVVLGLIVVILAIVIQRFKPPFPKIRSAFNVLALSLVILFFINFIPGARHELVLLRARAAEPFPLKREFYINDALPTPDILWIHADGMVSLELVERFWGVSQEHVREAFAQRDFIIYEDAFLNAGYTLSALTSLFSPAFYDDFFSERLSQVENELRTGRSDFLDDALAQVGLTYSDDMVPNYELFIAFVVRGYNVVINPGFELYMPQSFLHLNDNVTYVTEQRVSFLQDLGDLPELLRLTTPLNIPPMSEFFPVIEVQQVEINQFDHESNPFASFIWTPLSYTHMSTVWWFDPDITERDDTAIHAYPAAYEHMIENILQIVDLAIEENPNVIIVIQSDHGIHLPQTQQFMLDQGYSHEQVLELSLSVLSAARIPPEYGGMDEPIAPLNISRELVNRFVGDNYTLLP